MKYKNFQAADQKAVETQINQWLRGKNVTINRSDSSLGTVSIPVTVNGKKATKKMPYVSVNVWYEEKSN